jgi:NADH-quinone oxidoreductase subunit F
MKILDLDTLNDIRQTGLQKLLPGKPRIGVGMGTCGIGNGAADVMAALREQLDARGLQAMVVPVGCFGFCAAEPLVNVHLPHQPMVILSGVTVEDVPAIVDAVKNGEPPGVKRMCKVEAWDHVTAHIRYGEGLPEVPHWHEVPFFQGQKKVVLRHSGLINPEDIEEYIAVGGYQALHQARQAPNPASIIEEIKRAKLRGRGGAGYPTGVKWDLLRKTGAERKTMICNADEGDPGAYMNRNEIESDPHSLLEGMLIGALATGSTDGVVYLRAEYPLAVERLEKALSQARAAGLIGHDIFGGGFSFDMKLVEGAGAFVCGEETAMIASLEGKAGRPRPRPPYPAEKGLWGHPTNINNVETWFNVPVIVARGGDWFASMGTPSSAGTKVFSLVGKIKNTGLVEMPLGTKLEDIVYGAGEGSPGGRTLKAVQTGGPSGGCIPSQHFHTPVDYEALAGLGAIMGSGGVVVMDEDTCMVDVARYFVEFSKSESCGKCTPCRAGLDQALRILNRITDGSASFADLNELRDLGYMIREASLCGLGQTAPNPVLTTLQYFRNEYDEHIRTSRCRSGVCEKLFVAPCENDCPLHMRVPIYLTLLKEKKRDEATELVWLENPLPASTGRLCPAECETRCRRITVDGPVNMKEVHRYIADRAFEGSLDELNRRLADRQLPSTGKKVAITGAGPSGLTAAYYLALLGHAVDVYEAREEPGGYLRYDVPRFQLPLAVLEHEIDLIRGLGVTFHTGQRLGQDVKISDIEKDHGAVFVATGAPQPASDGSGVSMHMAYLRSELLTLNDHGGVSADALTGKTDRPHTYAGGAVTGGSPNLAEAMAQAKGAALAIDRLLTGEDRSGALVGTYKYRRMPMLKALGGERHESEVRELGPGADSLQEVLTGLGDEDALNESRRCLRCDVKAECVHPR